MSIERVALIFDNSARPETTGLYCRRALGNLVEVEHFLPSEVAELSADDFDLFLSIDDGLRYQLPDRLRPSAYWAIDTHLDFDWALEKAQNTDFTFVAQRPGALDLCRHVERCWWLPLACDPTVHGRRDVPQQYDLAFVGNLFGGRRQELVELLAQHYPNSFVGRRYLEEMAATYSSAKIVFNQSISTDVNMRVFEALCSGSLLLTNDLSDFGQNELFLPEHDLVTFESAEELLDKVSFYLANDDARRQIARQGQRTALEKHTYLHRMQRLLECVEGAQTTVAPDAPRISACLVSWQRRDNLAAILRSLREAAAIDDIVIYNNDPAHPITVDDDRVTVINSHRNEVTYGRFLAAQRAQHDVIYTQDDDCIVENIAALVSSYALAPDRITHNLKLTHLSCNEENRIGSGFMGLVGWGAVFHRDRLNVFREYIDVDGEDELLRRKADRIFTILQGRRHRPLPAAVVDLPGASGAEALSVRDDHMELTRQAMARCQRILASREGEIGSQTMSVSGVELATVSAETAKQDPSYYEHLRPELLDLVPPEAKRILDVGCGAGALGNALRDRQGAEVIGIERESAIAEAAQRHLDQVVEGDVQEVDLASLGEFDAIICGDVLEHLRDPLGVLSKLRQRLSDSGKMVASIPNVRHHSVISSLLAGNWTYEAAGLLDADHVRFFTRREIEKLFYRAGFQIDQTLAIPGPGYVEWKEQGTPDTVNVGGLTLSGMHPDDAMEFFVYQFLIVASPRPRPRCETVSIIIVTFNELEYTRQCVDSIRLVTDEPYELVFIDNASTDGTPEFLDSIPAATVIHNRENRGFPAAVNQGLAAATGDHFLLLNNDVVVTTGWLRRMLDAMHSQERIGLVGPCSNNVSGEQCIGVDYTSLNDLDGFAWEWGRRHAGEIVATDRLVGFCLLIRGEVVSTIGEMDEQFGVGCFEDDDFCRRASEAGYRAVMARDSFVHHYGSRTFIGSGVDLGQLLQENEQKYDAKWSAVANTGGKPEAEGGAQHQSLIPNPADSTSAAAPKLSLCMIVRDNEDTIDACLRSIQPWVDEIIVVDTGSRDRTPEICKKYGAKLFHFEWCDNFSAARNESLSHAAGEWIFWMDSDDTITPECGRQLRALAYADHKPQTLGYILQVHCPGRSDDGSIETTIVDHVKLFRNRDDLRFEMRIHEQILPAIGRAGGNVEYTDIYVVHSGSDPTPEVRAKKLERDFRILHTELIERPDHPFVLFNLGMTYSDAGQFEQAIISLERCLAVSKPVESHVRKAYALLVSTLFQSKHHEEAWKTAQVALELFPEDKELLFRTAILHQHFQRYEQAVAAYKQVLNGSATRYLSSVVSGIDGHLARHNLARTYEQMGNDQQAEQQWREITAAHPQYLSGWRGLGKFLLRRGRWDDVKSLTSVLQERGFGSLGATLLAEAQEQLGEIDVARQLLVNWLSTHPDDEEVLRELSRLLFDRVGPLEAAPYLKQLHGVAEDDGSVTHNLATIEFQAQNYQEAAELYRQSIQVRPNSDTTWIQLGASLSECGQREQAIRAWRDGLMHFPGHPQLRQLIERFSRAS